MVKSSTCSFLIDTYETEILKTTTIWSALAGASLDFRPAAKSRSVLEQMEHQVQSEGRWMKEMLGIETGDPDPKDRTVEGFVTKYRNDARRRLEILRAKSDQWWREEAGFFDVTRSRAWIFTRRLTHSAHHRGQLVVYLRFLGIKVPSVYGPTADTAGKVIYHF